MAYPKSQAGPPSLGSPVDFPPTSADSLFSIHWSDTHAAICCSSASMCAGTFRQSHPTQHLQQVIRNINFPPEKSLPGGRHEVVMIVMPAFAQGQNREQPIILAGVVGVVAPRAKQVRQ